MGFLARSATVVSPARVRGQSGGDDPFARLYNGFYPPDWVIGLSAAGVPVTPELALMLSAMYSGVTRVGGDFMRMPAHVLRVRSDGGKDRVRGGPTTGGIGGLAYRLRWKPNYVQTAAAFFACLSAQLLLRNRLYAEIVPDETGPIGQIIPRHPDRVIPAVLPSGRLKFKLIHEPNGQPPRFVTQEEMLFVHDTTAGGFNALTRMQYGKQAIGTSLAAEEAAGRFFTSGMNAALLATHPTGDMEDEDRARLHADISRFAAGKENAFGLMLVEDDIKVTALGLEPEKAQMMLARNFGVREVARLLRIPPELLFADNTGVQTGRTWEEIKAEYNTGCIGWIVAALEQAMQDTLVFAKETYIIEFLMDALFRGDLKSRAEYYQAAIEAPWMWPSEVRVKEGLNPDEALDTIAEKRYRPADPKGSASAGQTSRDRQADPNAAATDRQGLQIADRLAYRYHMALHDNAVRVLRRERAAVAKLAKKHADDVDGWQTGLREFYADHAHFIAETMRVDMRAARSYAAQHGSALQAHGVGLVDDHWERQEADELVELALGEPVGAAA